MVQERSLLDGIRVLEVATFVFGPAAATVMADFGAEVVKIEHPEIGDPYRYLKDLRPLPSFDENYCWLLTSRGKKSVGVDLKTEAGREIALELARRADVFVTNYHPSVLADLGLRYEDLASSNHRLVYAHATGYGEAGEEVEKPGYDASAWWARSGMMDCVRAGDADPGLATPGMGDHPSAMSVFGAIMLALYDRERSGRGTKVSTSLVANGVWANSIYLQAALCGAPAYDPKPRAAAHNALINHYVARDERRFYLVMVNERNEWKRFCSAIERPDLADDVRFAALEERRKNSPALIRILDEVFAREELSTWKARFEKHAITYSPVARTWELPEDPQLHANGLLPTIQGAREGLRTVDSPIRVRGAEKRPPSLAPEIGQHTREVLDSLGYDPSRIEALRQQGVVRLPS